jgi:hypothetical protein
MASGKYLREWVGGVVTGARRVDTHKQTIHSKLQKTTTKTATTTTSQKPYNNKNDKRNTIFRGSKQQDNETLLTQTSWQSQQIHDDF